MPRARPPEPVPPTPAVRRPAASIASSHPPVAVDTAPIPPASPKLRSVVATAPGLRGQARSPSCTVVFVASMINVEHIEDWRGKDVVDREGVALGKLHEVYYDQGSQ